MIQTTLPETITGKSLQNHENMANNNLPNLMLMPLITQKIVISPNELRQSLSNN